MVPPDMISVPGGRFAMGSEAGRPDEAPVHVVGVRGFSLSQTPITNRQYAACVSAGHVAAAPFSTQAACADPDQPVVGVTWFDAMSYCEWLSASTGACCRLPSEAEWERAARGGLEGAATSWGDALPPGEVPEGELAGPWLVGRGRPNGFGLLDIGTVVHEWCLDWYRADYYAMSPERDPLGPNEGTRRASRGGSWRHRVRWSPPSARSSLPPTYRYADYGFRVLREA